MRWYVAALALAVAFPSYAKAQFVSRVELHPVVSETPTDQQFLTGASGAPAATLSGELRLPRPGNDRLPAVVLLHGSGGIGGNIQAWVAELNKMGVATFMVDSFTGRGIASTQADQDVMSRLAMVVDAYRSLDLLAAHPRIDPTRIAVLGISRGGGAAHWAAMERFQRTHAKGTKARYALHIAFYPTCNREFKENMKLSGPVRIIHGTADDYIPIKECRELVARLRDAGQDASILEIEGAHHVFDAPSGTPSKVAQAQTTRSCPLIRESDSGVLVNSTTNQPFTYATDPCVERGTTVGHDPAGLEQSRRAVREMLTQAGFVRQP
jgi:dienelactone hydrolase